MNSRSYLKIKTLKKCFHLMVDLKAKTMFSVLGFPRGFSLKPAGCCSLPSPPWVGTDTMVAAAGKKLNELSPFSAHLRRDTSLHLQGFRSQPLLNHCSNTNRGKKGVS